jgi:SAM-dependent methyltransferase
MTTEPRISDYRTHYRIDADLIEDPADLHPVRSASERRRLETIRRVLRLRPGELLLDLGCGSGWLAQLCHEAGIRVVATDIASAGVAGARARFPEAARFAVTDAYHTALANESFDAVVLSEVVEHLEDPGKGLGEAARITKRGGRILVTVPYRETIVEHLCVHCNRLTPANAHLHSFDDDTLRQLLAGVGLRPLSFHHMTNKLLELAGFPNLSRRWPYWSWRAVDGLLNGLTGKSAFLLMVAGKD